MTATEYDPAVHERLIQEFSDASYRRQKYGPKIYGAEPGYDAQEYCEIVDECHKKLNELAEMVNLLDGHRPDA